MRELIGDRMKKRKGHFMPPALLDSQFATLEKPTADEDAVILDISHTVPVLLAEAAPEAPGQVIGSDISRKVLASAQQGVYGPASFRTTTDAARDRLFLPAGPGLWKVPPSIRRMCSFVHLNLLDVGRFATLGRLDVIFCRNVLMYLSAPARHRIVEAFYDALVPGGFLLLGHSESLLNVTTRFDLVPGAPHYLDETTYKVRDAAWQWMRGFNLKN